MIDIIGNYAIRGALPTFIRFLIANEDIVRLLLVYDVKNTSLNLVDFSGLFFINFTLNSIGIFKGIFIIFVSCYCIVRSPVAGWYPFISCRIFYIFNSIFTKDKSPVRIGFCTTLLEYLLIDLRGFIKL